MNTTWNLKENSQGELLVTVEGDTWQSAQDKAFDKLAKNVEVDGFRKGSAPKNLIKNRIKEESILMEAVEGLAQEALVHGLDEHKLVPVARASLDLDHLDKDKVVYKFTVTVSPEVTLGQYKDLEIKPKGVKVTAKEIDEEVEKLRGNYAELVVIEDRAAKDGDTAVIDFEGFKDGVPFEGGKGENHSLVLGSGSFIPGFEEQVVGMNKDEEKDITVTFPAEYHAEDLAGQEVVFKVKVHEIKERVLPELNDEFAKEVNKEDVETFEQLKDSIKKELTATKKKAAEEEANNELFDKVVENSPVVIPEVMISEETDRMVEDFKNRIIQQGFPYDQFLQMTGQTEEGLREQMSTDAEKKVRLRLVLEAIAEKEQLNVSDEEVDAEYATIATTYNLEVDRVKELVDNQTIAYDLKIRKAYDLIKIS